MDEQTLTEAQSSTLVDAPADWATRQTMTDGQKWHLLFLSAEAGEAMNDNLTRVEASRRINELQAKLYRGKGKR